jgi:hypothetical protein
MKYNLPNFLIVGAAKSGTTSLYHYLAEHPEIFMSPIKEPNYFSQDIEISKLRPGYREKFGVPIESELLDYLNGSMEESLHCAIIQTFNSYIRLFKNVGNEKAVGEASVSYLYSKVAPETIKQTLPDCKIIIILRNPITRAFSHFLMNFGSQFKEKNFEEEIKNDLSKLNKGWGISELYLELGEYYKQVKRYINIFEHKNIRIYTYEDFSINGLKVLKDIYCFLKVDTSYIPNLNIKYNKSIRQKKIIELCTIERLKRFSIKKVPRYYRRLLDLKKERKPQIEKNALIFLKKYYDHDIKNLSKLLNKDFTMWSNV